MIRVKCAERRCKYYSGHRASYRKGFEVRTHFCKAFPRGGIPRDILYGDNEHLVPVPGQVGDMVYGYGFDSKRVGLKPYRVKEMERLNHGMDNLCSTIADIYARTDDDIIKFWCRCAMRMSKNMYGALTTYKHMLVEKGVKVGHEGREDWQIGRKNEAVTHNIDTE